MPNQPWKPKSPFSGAPMQRQNNMSKIPPSMGAPPWAPAPPAPSAPAPPSPSGFGEPRQAPHPAYGQAVQALGFGQPKQAPHPAYAQGVQALQPGTTKPAPAPAQPAAPPAGQQAPLNYWEQQARNLWEQEAVMDPQAWEAKAALERQRIASEYAGQRRQLQQQISAAGGGFGGGGLVQAGFLTQAEAMAKAASDTQIAIQQAQLAIEERLRGLQLAGGFASEAEKQALARDWYALEKQAKGFEEWQALQELWGEKGYGVATPEELAYYGAPSGPGSPKYRKFVNGQWWIYNQQTDSWELE